MARSRPPVEDLAHALAGRRSRRAALRGPVGGGAALAAGVGAPSTLAHDAATVGEWVGALAPGEDDRRATLVAVAAEPPAPEAAARRVRLSLCDGAGLAEWFAGDVAGNGFALTSTAVATAAGELTAAGVIGNVSQDGGEGRAFAAARATGVEGLHTVMVADDLFLGASARGVAFAFGTDAAGRLEGTFLPPSGEAEEVTAGPPRAALEVSGDGGGASWVIVRGDLPDPDVVRAVACLRPRCRFVPVTQADGTVVYREVCPCSLSDRTGSGNGASRPSHPAPQEGRDGEWEFDTLDVAPCRAPGAEAPGSGAAVGSSASSPARPAPLSNRVARKARAS